MQTNLKLIVLAVIAGMAATAPANAQVVTGWDAQGVPNNLADPFPISAGVMADINQALPEYRDVRVTHPDYIANDDRVRMTLTEEADIWMTFVHEGAGFRNVLGVFFYDAANPPTSIAQVAHEVVFPNASYLGSGGGLHTGDTVYLGRRPAGTSVGVWLQADGWNGSAIRPPGQRFYSLSSLNPENTAELRRHMVLLSLDGAGQMVLGIEDIGRTVPSCDQDFNDAMFIVRTNPVTAIDLAAITTLPGEADTDGDGVADYLDAYPSDPERASVQFTPSASGWEMLAFEDQWPEAGDYDFNDLIVRYRFREVLDAEGRVKDFNVLVEPMARGASIHNGLALQLPVAPAMVESAEAWQAGAPAASAERIETDGTSSTVVRLFDDAFGLWPGASSGFVNTVAGEGRRTADNIELRVVFATAVDRSVLGSAPYNPFIFRTFSRGHEVHLIDHQPSVRALATYFGTADDVSDPAAGHYYRNVQGFPWALLVPSNWTHPAEHNELTWAYPNFGTWAASGGATDPDWYSRGVEATFVWHE